MTEVGQRSRSKSDRHAKGEALALVLQELRGAIMDGRLGPGARIYQEAIAAEYGTSRLPVREALRQLSNEGLVVVLPNAGARVARLDPAELDEVYWLRERLEPAAVARSAERLSAEQLHALREQVERMEAIDPVVEPLPWLELDREFHVLALAGAGLPRAERIIESIWNLARPYRRAYATSVGADAFAIAEAEHRLLLDALERGHGADAAAILEIHIRRTRLALARSVEAPA